MQACFLTDATLKSITQRGRKKNFASKSIHPFGFAYILDKSIGINLAIRYEKRLTVFQFIADVHLGKLARYLRLLGFDVLYSNTYQPEEMIDIAAKQNRVLLSKNALLQKQHPDLSFCVVQHSDPVEQLQQVIKQFDLLRQVQPFTRCLICNGMLVSVLKEDILLFLPENTAKYYDEFWQCAQCSRIYWKGAHYNRMIKWLHRLEEIIK